MLTDTQTGLGRWFQAVHTSHPHPLPNCAAPVRVSMPMEARPRAQKWLFWSYIGLYVVCGPEGTTASKCNPGPYFQGVPGPYIVESHRAGVAAPAIKWSGWLGASFLVGVSRVRCFQVYGGPPRGPLGWFGWHQRLATTPLGGGDHVLVQGRVHFGSAPPCRYVFGQTRVLGTHAGKVALTNRKAPNS